VAYDSSLSAYRVFGCTGSVTDDSKSPASIVSRPYLSFFCLVIIEALLRGVTDGQDILTLSLGGVNGWTESSSSIVASRIAASGKVVTVAAGNDVRPVSESFCKLDRLLMLMVKGASGSWYSSSPGNGVDVISVSSVDK